MEEKNVSACVPILTSDSSLLNTVLHYPISLTKEKGGPHRRYNRDGQMHVPKSRPNPQKRSVTRRNSKRPKAIGKYRHNKQTGGVRPISFGSRNLRQMLRTAPKRALT